MLTYLDALIAALTVRDAADVDRLLAHPLVRILAAGRRAPKWRRCASTAPDPARRAAPPDAAAAPDRRAAA